MTTQWPGEVRLGEMTAQEFLEQYWQKKPLLIRQAVPGMTSPITADELAGLACEEEVESRIILECDGVSPWELRHGPFEESEFTRLPETRWTLLVQEANKYVPELADLLEHFHFIPNWRVDDVMVSYAADQGSVGPHTDNYDVFLLQAWGKRRWQIAPPITANDIWVEGIELRILKEFQSEEEWMLEPGDMLYLPPGVPHYGVAQGECMTFSVGLRAPQAIELASAWADHRLDEIDETLFYIDPELRVAEHPGEISRDAVAKLSGQLRDALCDADAMGRWIGSYLTAPRRYTDMEDERIEISEQEFVAKLEESTHLLRSEYYRFAYIAAADGVHLYVHGQAWWIAQAGAGAVPLLCDSRYIDARQLAEYMKHDDVRRVCTELYGKGRLHFDHEL